MRKLCINSLGCPNYKYLQTYIEYCRTLIRSYDANAPYFGIQDDKFAGEFTKQRVMNICNDLECQLLGHWSLICNHLDEMEKSLNI
jgi:hypothetical protein